jgi:L-aspartate oxidase
MTREGGHSARRIIHARDRTGHAILAAVAGRVDRTPLVRRHMDSVAIDLLTLSHNNENPEDRYAPLTCFGAYGLIDGYPEPVAIVAKKTVLACGGLGQIYQHEYVQFHPTVFYGKNAPRFLITEALRGEGARLVNLQGEPFMDVVHARGSLAPRDIVSRAIHEELSNSGEPCVYLDLSALDRSALPDRFPTVYERCLEHGVDITRDQIPVVPAAHYSCGGVHTDLDGRTNIRHLGAIGETACTGLHGANRLASTSLLECLTGARAAARADARDIAAVDFRLPEPRPWLSPTEQSDPTLIHQDLNLVQQTMWNYAGIVRSQRRLTRARRILLELREEIQSFYRDCRVTRELVELRNAVQAGLLVVHAASLNPRSKGAHYIIDE